jgi:hypothetical protein
VQHGIMQRNTSKMVIWAARAVMHIKLLLLVILAYQSQQ